MKTETIKAYHHFNSSQFIEVKLKYSEDRAVWGPKLYYDEVERKTGVINRFWDGNSIRPAPNAPAAPIHYAAGLGYIDALRSWLDVGIEVDYRDENDATPLMRAASSGRIECIKELLDRGANVSLTDDKGLTALDRARRYHQLFNNARSLEVLALLGLSPEVDVLPEVELLKYPPPSAACEHTRVRKASITSNGKQNFRCEDCGKRSIKFADRYRDQLNRLLEFDSVKRLEPSAEKRGLLERAANFLGLGSTQTERV